MPHRPSQQQTGCPGAFWYADSGSGPCTAVRRCTALALKTSERWLGRQGAADATSQTLVEFKDSALHSLDGSVRDVQARPSRQRPAYRFDFRR